MNINWNTIIKSFSPGFFVNCGLCFGTMPKIDDVVVNYYTTPKKSIRFISDLGDIKIKAQVLFGPICDQCLYVIASENNANIEIRQNCFLCNCETGRDGSNTIEGKLNQTLITINNTKLTKGVCCKPFCIHCYLQLKKRKAVEFNMKIESSLCLTKSH